MESKGKAFDRNQYMKEYRKNHKPDTATIKADVDRQIFDKIEMFCKDMGISKAKFVQLACLYVINNDLFGEIMQNEETSYCTSRHKKKKNPEELAAEINAEQERKERKK